MSAIQKLLTDHIAIWTDADTEKKSGRGRSSGNGNSVYGVKKLRELILELAVRGKLVPQDPKDEPASELLKAIQVEKARLIAEGKAKKEKPLPVISEGDQPFNLPAGWSWEKLGNVFSFEYGDNLPAEKRSNTGEFPVYGSNGIVGSHNICFVNSPCIVIGRKGSAGALNLCLAKGCCVTDVAYYCVPPKSLDLVFSFKLFHTLGLDNLGKGIKPGLNRNEAYELPIAIPPLAEQHRIVAKVDELMALCDQLETQHNNAAEAHEKLVTQLLAALTQSKNAAEFSENWQRIAAHFDTLFTTEASIDALKQTLLQLAVMGKLVPQDPNDEPARELLKKIQAEKAKLIAEGKLKKEKPLPEIIEEEQPFQLPSGWSWARFQSAIDVRDGTHDSPKDAIGEDTFPLITSKDFKNGEIEFSNARYISKEDYLEIQKRSFVEENDILFSMIGGNIGNQVMVKSQTAFAIKNVALFKYYDKKCTNPFFIKIVMEDLSERLQAAAVGGAQPFVSLGFLRNLLMALPPIAEQGRIVAKVDELVSLCEKLKSRITEANRLQQKLADAVVEQALAS